MPIAFDGFEWQGPVATELEFYRQNKGKPGYFPFPWAQLIDLKTSRRPTGSVSNGYTCCQHISFRDIIPLMKSHGITTVYSPHKIKGQDSINGVSIKPCPLFAVNFETPGRNLVFRNRNVKSSEGKKYLYSFMGAHQPGYLTGIRPAIFAKCSGYAETRIINVGDWHFNNAVYGGGVRPGRDLSTETDEYNRLLLNSKFSLCPSGTGPNSIRFWECLAIGCVPVLLSDSLELPKSNWENAIVSINESDVISGGHAALKRILESISDEKYKLMSEECVKIYNSFKNNYRL